MYETIVIQSKWCDVKVNNTWRLASINKTEGDLISVSFDGWSSNKNKVYNLLIRPYVFIPQTLPLLGCILEVTLVSLHTP
jgi:hypothetical protein